jgi:hypothetical protein
MADPNILSDVRVADIVNTPSLNQNKGTASKPRKRKSDDADLVLPDGSRRVRKKKSCPDENIPASAKKGKKKVSGRK